MTGPGAPLPVDRFDYELPPELIAQHPIEPRDASRLLVVHRECGSLEDRVFRELPDLLRPGDLLVFNDTRVLPARLFARRTTGGAVELLLLERGASSVWQALARPRRKLRQGESLRLVDQAGNLTDDIVRVIGHNTTEVVVEFDDEGAIQRCGRVPLPPYIRESLDDAERYQTVYARVPGSAAAPTAGLHFTPELIERCRSAGVETATVTLHVGLDTFQPIQAADAREHAMHSERFAVAGDVFRVIRNAREEGRRIVAVGTTTVRTLESLGDALENSPNECAICGSTRLFITPGYTFRVVDAMITNFHLPRTTLLLLVASLAGEDLTRAAYAHAVAQRYRFYSFGDAMLIV